MIKLLIKFLPDFILDFVNAETLAEMDKRKLIVWAEKIPVISPESENSAFNLSSRFTEVTPENMPEVFKASAQIYTNHGNCLAFTYLMNWPQNILD
ncbi:hypothetical protein [Nostoc sp. MG11]|uniref:hypothetical protein n=1 Tax=Nostoc sp. MG11 TaxID=2721166 RepID=UPI001867F7BC|nr:hypothetical protein [Nostoc sp. MG11]